MSDRHFHRRHTDERPWREPKAVDRSQERRRQFAGPPSGAHGPQAPAVVTVKQPSANGHRRRTMHENPLPSRAA